MIDYCYACLAIFSYLGFIYIKPFYAFAFLIGYASHLLSDGFTKMGVNFLHPVAKLHLSGFVETGTYAEVVILIAILVLIVVQIL